MRKQRFCTIEGCCRKHYGRGYCYSHWDALNLYGDPLYRKRNPIKFNGQAKSIRQWAKDIGIHPASLGQRIRDGWPIELALTTPRYKQGGPRVGPKWEQIRALHAQAARPSPP